MTEDNDITEHIRMTPAEFAEWERRTAANLNACIMHLLWQGRITTEEAQALKNAMTGNGTETGRP